VFRRIDAGSLKRMAGTTGLEAAASAVTEKSIGDCLKLRGTDGYQDSIQQLQGAIIGP
jgi:hypothetical protein